MTVESSLMVANFGKNLSYEEKYKDSRILIGCKQFGCLLLYDADSFAFIN